MIGPMEVVILAVLCLVPAGIILGAMGIVKLTRRKGSTPGGNADLAIASLVTGILSLFGWLAPLIGVPIAVVGLVLGGMSRNSARRGMAIAGMVMAGIGLLIGVVYAGVTLFMNYE